MQWKKTVRWAVLSATVALALPAAVLPSAAAPLSQQPEAITCGDSATCSTSYAALQIINSGAGPAIYGNHTSPGWGRYGIRGYGSPGVYGSSWGYPGVQGKSTTGIGVRGDSTEGAGVLATSVSGDGVEASSEGGHGLYVSSAGDDGVYVGTAVYNGFYVNSAGWDGVYVTSADSDGVVVQSAGYDGVYANTTRASHEWGVFTPDAIYAGSALTSGGPSMIVAQNGDGAPLEPATVVAVSGRGTPFGESDVPAPLVRRAGVDRGAVAGVVYARFVAEEKVEEVEHDGQVEQRTSLHSRSVEGTAAPGDYLLVVVLGPALVRASGAAGGIAPGEVLEAGGDGLAVRMGEGYRAGQLVGTAMDGLEAGQGSGLIWVLVIPR